MNQFLRRSSKQVIANQTKQTVDEIFNEVCGPLDGKVISEEDAGKLHAKLMEYMKSQIIPQP